MAPVAPKPRRWAQIGRAGPGTRRSATALVDLAVTLLIAAILASYLRPIAERLGDGPAMVLVGAALMACAAAAVTRRSRPLGLIAALGASGAILAVAAGDVNVTLLAALIAFFGQAYEDRTRVRWLVVAAATAVVVFASLLDGGWSQLTADSLVLATGLGWGQGVRSSRLYRASLTERAEVAERERDLRAAQAVAEERARIARDIHDIVSHSLAVVAVQAAGAQRVAERNPERAREALVLIGETARGALTEMRAMLHVLRSGDTATQPDAPSPGLPQIDALATDMTARGLPVELVTEGQPFGLGAGAELAVFRVVQESLTNALKHGDRSHAALVNLRYEPDQLVVSVVNNLRGEGSEPAAEGAIPGSGSGQAGMSERLALYEGTLDFGHSSGRYWVRATVPRPRKELGEVLPAEDGGATP